MTFSDWTQLISAIGALLTPLTVAIAAFFFGRRQSRSEQLQRVRLDYYEELMPDLNRLMCYLTFIGTWRDDSPVDIVALKRRLDARMASARPLFSSGVSSSYEALMALSFATFGDWGEDARIISSPYRRREAWKRTDPVWQPTWNVCFSLGEEATITGSTLARYRFAYDKLVSAIVRDLNINRARAQYTTGLVSLNASAPVPNSVRGKPSAD